MNRNLHSFQPGQTAVMFGLRAHTNNNGNQKADGDNQTYVTYSEQIQNRSARFKINWLPTFVLPKRFVNKINSEKH